MPIFFINVNHSHIEVKREMRIIINSFVIMAKFRRDWCYMKSYKIIEDGFSLERE
ncbi:hypothetical protein JCM30760_01360 [Thiomicrorhabdus hydrogeniphila]